MRNLLVIMLAFTVSAAKAEIKVGIVNIQKIISSIEEGKSVNKTLEKSFKSKQKVLKDEEESIKKLITNLQKQDAVLSDAAKAKKAQEINEKRKTAAEKMRQFQAEIQKQEAELKKPILDKLKPVIDDVSKAEKVSLTFEISASPPIYAAEKIDLTEKIIKAYDKKHSK
ncbi:MAG: OmpH family outer membrane protein [Bdellovibrionota bacterium]|nr:OmpH family outer membrane protein [Bdellovibrionota bacterium]